MKQLFISLFIILSICLETLSSQSIRLNEVSSNNCFLMDEDTDFSDWIELHNFGLDPINLENYTLSDDIEDPKKWEIKNITINPDEYQLIWASGKDRPESQHFRTIVTKGDSFRYVRPNAITSLNWKKTTFNDSDWDYKPSGFGYGDGDDETSLPIGTESVFLRKKIIISNVLDLNNLILQIDYDDGFVAYLNEIEVARANISAQSPTYNEPANEYVEPKLINGESLEIFEVGNLEEILQEGENILAIQVHNSSSNSSDFTAIPFVSISYKNQVSVGINPPEFLHLEERFPHTNFKISSEGETVYLFDEAENIVDSLKTGKVSPNITVGKLGDNPETIAYFSEGTPWKKNPLFGFQGMVESVVEYSSPGGITDPFDLILSTENPSDEIRYTTNSTEPNSSSTLYEGPINIANNTVIRSKAFRQNFLPSSTFSSSFITSGDHTLPVINLITDPNNLWDYNNGIYTNGPGYNAEFPHFGSNFWEDWEVPMYFTYHEAPGEEAISFYGGAKIFGGYSRAYPQKSFSLFARSKYGDKKFDYPFFETRDYNDFEALVLRNSGNDWTRANMRDICNTSLMEGTGIDIQAYKQTIVYLNGTYWGHYNLREKVNEHFLSARHNVHKDSIDLLFGPGEIIEGDNSDYFELFDFIDQNTLTTPANYEYVKNKIDIDNFTLYHLTNIYLDNTDWPGNNIKFWKPKNGKWKWIMYDTDFGLGIWNVYSYFNNTLAFALEPNGPNWPNPPWSTLFLRKLTQNNTYKNYFINYFADEMNSRFLEENIHQVIDKNKALISPEILQHFDRWNEPISFWNTSVEDMKTFATFRQTTVKENILSQFNLPNYHELIIENDQIESGFVKINERLNIEVPSWEGDYFENNIFAVKAIPKQGFVFSHWEGDSESTSAELQINISSPMTLIPIFIESPHGPNVVINEINYKSSDDKDTEDWIEIYNNSPSGIDISGWNLKDSDNDHNFIFPEQTFMEPNEFFVIAKSISKFQAIYPEVNVYPIEFDYGLSSENETIRLFDNDGILHDSVNYLSVFPWPEEANGTGGTLQLLNPNLDNSLAENWSAFSECGTPGQENYNPTSIENSVQELSFTLFPNPVGKTISLKSKQAYHEEVTMDILNMEGNYISEIFDGRLYENTFITRSVENIPPGMYVLRIRSNGGILENIRFVKL